MANQDVERTKQNLTIESATATAKAKATTTATSTATAMMMLTSRYTISDLS